MSCTHATTGSIRAAVAADQPRAALISSACQHWCVLAWGQAAASSPGAGSGDNLTAVTRTPQWARRCTATCAQTGTHLGFQGIMNNKMELF